MLFYISHVSLVHLSWSQPDSSVTALVGHPQRRGAWDMNFLKIYLHLLRHTKEKTDDENESNGPESFVTQTIPSWPKYLMA